ncbi:MAG: ATP phosphoribosyltransferase [Spirochaetaceae bacterium]|nr:MAG: ATP phosphoribosyltransferase [Spirochaetaceae bacterium]
MKDTSSPLTLALPKGRLTDQVQQFLKSCNIDIDFDSRKLMAEDSQGLLRVFLVKNSDLTTYVHHGIAGLGVCGDDTLIESGHQLIKLHTFDFGSTKMCLAAPKGSEALSGGLVTIATKYVEFTRQFYGAKGQETRIIRLNGSVELAPLLGLAPCIVDLVETGSTLKANNLEVLQELAEIKVHLVANPSYYKLNFRQIDKLVQTIQTSAEN